MSKRTIQLSQKSLDVSVSNMSNMKTPGFSRQRVDVHSMFLSSYKNWQTRMSRLSLAGQGAGAHGVAQVRDFYLDKRFREMNGFMAECERKLPILEEIQTTIDNFENVGMEAKLAQFKDALSKYGTNAPDAAEFATLVRNSAQQIADMLKTYARDYDRLLESNVFELNATVDYVNTLIEKVTTLNKAIVKEYKSTEYGAIYNGRGVSPYGPLELMDERNLVLDELSSFANIKVEENVDGSINVWLGEILMVQGEKYEHFVMHEFDKFDSAVIFASNGQVPNIRSGEIKAYMDLVNGNGPYANHHQSSAYGIPYYKSAIDAFAEAFAGLMNETNGMTLDNPYRAMFGSTLDVYDEEGTLVSRGPINASTIRISDEWMNDATMIGLMYSENESVLVSTFSFTQAIHTFSFPSGGGPYDFDVTLGSDTQQISFDGTAADLQTQLDAAFPGGFLVDDDGVGNITVSAVNSSDLINVDSADVAVTANGVGPYDFEVSLNGVEQTVSFNGTAADLQTQLDAVFPGGFTVGSDDSGNVTINATDTSALIDITSTGALVPTEDKEIVVTGGWAYSTTLDGTHVKELLLALDKPVKYGRALDFEGSAFDYIAFISNRLGQGISFIEEQLDTMVVTTNNLLDSRDAVMGVSNDEEGINMLIYQKWYNAAARMMTALDECLDRVINGMGRVGL
ncbi:MAG: hypothetical protein FWG70_04780 [Oscillospiraceae bacterium]|nr:hypothetical protein [Oscillospiraceae bacterium]